MPKRLKPMAVLFSIAEEQQGYFTTRQASDAGYRFGSQAYHIKVGNWARVARGVYRLVRFPQSDEEQLVVYSLWSRNRAGAPEGVYSHQTALSIHGLSDINPAKLHMIVPLTFRRSAQLPKILALHYFTLEGKDVEQRPGFRVTRPLRTIIDLVVAEQVSRDTIIQALTEGRNRGLISGCEIIDWRRRGQHVPSWFVKILTRKGK